MKQTDMKNYKPKLNSYVVRDDLMRSLLLRIYPSGKKSWLLDYTRPDGRRNTIKLGDAAQILSPVQAREIARLKLIEIAKGVDPNAKTESLTLRSLIDKYYQKHVTAYHKQPASTLSMLRGNFAFLLDRRLEDIRKIDVENWEIEEKKNNKASSINRKIGTLKAALTWAVEHELLSASPLIRLKSLPETDSNKKVRYLSQEERTRLMVALNGVDGVMKPLIITALNTGIRRGALFALKWEDVNFTEQTITLQAESAKNKKFNTVPMNNATITALSEWKRQRINGFVFPSPVTGGALDNCKKSWATLLKNANIKNFRWHDMRHDFASRLVMAGVDLNTVRELLTHGDIKTTLKYAHLAPEKTKSAVDLLD